MPSKKPAEALETYAKKRNFSNTPEPSDAPAKSKASRGKRQRFVVQMHRASRLHYDFRLEDEGVLKSWAIPKGPSFDTREKRLAMAVEDHPLDYRDFEGIIPKGNYGAGEVVVWDRGTYRLTEGTSTTEQIAKGSVKIEMFGEKLHGTFALVHIKGRGGEENAWLLIKERDEFVDPTWRIEDHSESVKSGKTVAELANDPKAPHWISNRPMEQAPAKAKIVGRAEKMPDVESLMLATAVDAPFDDPKWVFELKWDGYRALARIDAEKHVALVSRNGQDFTPKFPELASLADAFSERPLLIDGELVVLDASGHPSFSGLQERLDRFGRTQPEKRPVTYVVFDVLYGNGRDLREEPLEKRKAILEQLLTGKGPVMLSKHVVRDGIGLFEVARSQGLEGIVGKRADSKYIGRRSRDWVKVKTQMRQEVVIGGWTEARGSRKHFGALLVGVYEGGGFVYVGSVGTGFDGKKLAAIAEQLAPLERATTPFAVKPKTDTPAHWVTPHFVAEVSFAEWTRELLMRQPVFVALRTDKDQADVTREIPKHMEGEVETRDAAPANDASTKKARAPRAATTSTTKKSAEKSKGPVAVSADEPASEVVRPIAVASTKKSKERLALEIDGRSLAISNSSKVLWPQDGYTKADLIAYYRAAAPYMVPELRGRPLTLERFPDGIDESSFFEKHAPKYLPPWIETVPVESDSGRRPPIPFMLCNDEASLVYVANLAAIILHVWTSRAGSLETPDFLFFDLDPSEDCKVATLAKVALELRASLTEIGLVAMIKSSGGYGLHVAVPLKPDYGYDFAKGFGELLARRVHAAVPDLTTLERMPAKRPPATVYLDYVQVGKGKTLVAPYSVRAREHAPISMPMDWSEIETMRKSRTVGTLSEFARFTIRNAPPMFAERSPLWNSATWKEQRLDAALKKAQKLWT